METEWEEAIRAAFKRLATAAHNAMQVVREAGELPEGLRPPLERILPPDGWAQFGRYSWPHETDLQKLGVRNTHALIWEPGMERVFVDAIMRDCGHDPRRVLRAVRAIQRAAARCESVRRRVEREGEWAARRWERRNGRWLRALRAEAALAALATEDTPHCRTPRTPRP
jgi:hypothetical protein